MSLNGLPCTEAGCSAVIVSTWPVTCGAGHQPDPGEVALAESTRLQQHTVPLPRSTRPAPRLGASRPAENGPADPGWVCPQGGPIVDEGDGGRCAVKRHVHRYSERIATDDAAAWSAGFGRENGARQTFSTLYSPINRGVESRESFPPSGGGLEGNALRGPNRQFGVLTLAELLAREDPPQEWAVDGLLLADGSSYVASKPKVGKTVTALNLVAAAASGVPFLGRRTAPGRVLLMALEEREAKVKAVLRQLVGGLPDEAQAEVGQRVVVHIGSAPRDGFGYLADLIARYAPQLVIVDTVAKLCRFVDINDYSEVLDKLEPITELARQARCHIALLGHLGKAERTDSTDEVLGSTALTAAVDTIVMLKRAPVDGSRTIYTRQRDGDDMPESLLEYDSSSGRCWLGSSRDEHKRLMVRAEVCGMLRDDGILGEVQVREMTAHAAKDISRALRELVADGTVTRYGSGKRGDPYRYGVASAAPRGEDDHAD